MSEKLVDPEMGRVGAPEKGAFLSGPPRSGELSPFAQKVATQAFVWLASIIVFGATSDVAHASGKCNSLCMYGIVAGVVSFIFSSFLLVAHYMCLMGRMDRNGWFTSAAERRFMIALAMWWGPAVGGLSALLRNDVGPSPHTNGVAIFFGWLAFFGSIYGAYKCYHVQQEEESYLSLHQQMTIEAENNDEEYANFS
jgi:hypothetical protein